MFLTATSLRRTQVHSVAFLSPTQTLNTSRAPSNRSRKSFAVAGIWSVAAAISQTVHSSFMASSSPRRCVECFLVAFRHRSSSQASMEEMKYTPNSSVAPLGKPSIDFSVLDEKLGEGVAKGIWLMICDAVTQEMHGVSTTLSEVLKAVNSSSKTKSQYLELPNTTPLGAPPSNVSKHLDSDIAFRPSKGMKFFGPELAFAAYIFGNNLKLEEELVTNAHCDGTQRTLQELMPGKPISGNVLCLSLLNA